jgi:hypothetical protein
MSINQLYHTLFCQMEELRPGQRITQLRNFVWLMVGIHQSRSVKLSSIAGKIPGEAELLSTTRRLRRLVKNDAIQVREWYEPIARQWLEAQFNSLGEIRLIVDGTKVGFGHKLLMVAMAYRHRAIPIVWVWVNHPFGRSSSEKQIELLRYVHTLVPKGATVYLVGDAEFGAGAILRALDNWNWFYVLRQKTDTLMRRKGQKGWKSFGSFVEKSGQSVWLGQCDLVESNPYRVNLLAHWKEGEKEPWCLATNLPDQKTTLDYYKRRMWIEEMFGDMKGHGFDLERTMLRHAERLSRLTLAVVLLFAWSVSVGVSVIKGGLRPLVDRPDRRDLSIFQIGLRYIERRLTNGLPPLFSLCRFY